MYLKLKVSYKYILRRLLGVIGARTFFVKTRQANVDVMIRKQCYNLKLRNEGSHSRVIKSIFDSCSFMTSKLFDKLRDNVEVTRI